MGTQLMLSCGIVRPISLRDISQIIRREVHRPAQASFGDPFIDVIQMLMEASELEANFRRKSYKLSKIFTYHKNTPKHLEEIAVNRFAALNLKEEIKNLKVSISTDQLTLEELHEASIRFAERMGGNGYLVFVDANTSVLLDENDFTLHLVDVVDNSTKVKTLNGAVSCNYPERVIKIEHRKSIILSELI